MVFEKPEQPHAPLLAGHQGLVGEIDLAILHGGKKGTLNHPSALRRWESQPLGSDLV